MIPATASKSAAALYPKNVFLVLEYDGTAYAGWQRQKSDPTIQGTIEAALTVMLRQKVTLHGSGRTDAGVHAWGQTANFQCRTRLTPETFQKGLNSLLPEDIVILNCQEVPLKFHARYDALRKTYSYQVYNAPLPRAVGRRYFWQIRRPLDLTAMTDAASHLIGEHDFKAFEASGSPRAHTRRQIYRAELMPADDKSFRFEIEADGFLRHMVRNIVGTLVEVGQGKTSVARFIEILASKDRNQAGPTAPPQGLFLKEVVYASEALAVG